MYVLHFCPVISFFDLKYSVATLNLLHMTKKKAISIFKVVSFEKKFKIFIYKIFNIFYNINLNKLKLG